MSSSDAATWTNEENIHLCEAWWVTSHDSITGNKIKVDLLWNKIKEEFDKRCPGTSRTASGIQTHWKRLVVKFNAWRYAIKQGRAVVQPSGSNAQALDDAIQAFYKSKAKSTKNFTDHDLWDIVKHSHRFKIVDDTPINMHIPEETPGEDSPVPENLSDDDTPIRLTRPQGRKAAKEARAARKKTPSENSRFFEQIAQQGAISIEDFRAREADRKAELQARMAQVAEANAEERELRIMSMDTSKFSPLTAQYWRNKRRGYMPRELFPADDPELGGESSTGQGSHQTPYYPEQPWINHGDE